MLNNLLTALVSTGAFFTFYLIHMDVNLLFQQAKSYIDQSMSGLEVENQKVDFKSQWYKLKTRRGINEFLKDTSAMANTFGPDGIIIIGYNEKDKSQSNVSFKDSGLPDTSQLTDIINSKVDRLFQINVFETNINGFSTSIIQIPPSIDKPHVIRNYQTCDKSTDVVTREEQQRIFIR